MPRLLTALVVGLLLGCLAALALGAASRRLRTAPEVARKLGLEPIAVLPGGIDDDSARLRTHRVRNLVTQLDLGEKSAEIVAFTGPDQSAAVLQVAEEVAVERAKQGKRTLLIDADLRRADSDTPDVLGDVDTADLAAAVADTDVPNLRRIQLGAGDIEPFAALSRARFEALTARLRDFADFLVVAAPPIASAAETQAICAVADHTVLVLDTAQATVRPAREALSLLEPIRTELLGVVLADAVAQPIEPSDDAVVQESNTELADEPVVETVEPETVEPETVEPETVEPETVEPETVERETVEPETVEPETVEPETVEPGPRGGRPRSARARTGRSARSRATRPKDDPEKNVPEKNARAKDGKSSDLEA